MRITFDLMCPDGRVEAKELPLNSTSNGIRVFCNLQADVLTFYRKTGEVRYRNIILWSN